MNNKCKWCDATLLKKSVFCNVNCMTLYYRKDKILSNCIICNKEIVSPKSISKKYCSELCYHASKKGKKRPEQSLFMKGNTIRKGAKLTKEQREKVSGENNPKFKGGICQFNYLKAQIRKLQEYKTWRISVFKRDLFTCQKCGIKNVRLECHHIVGYSEIVKNNNILSPKDALNCSLMWDTQNGKTLCKSCHKKTDNYAKNTN